jgi:hypothetical protein
MMRQPVFASSTREIFVLRLWRRTPQSRWIVEIQNVKTNEVAHLSGLEAIARCIEDQVGSGSSEADTRPSDPAPSRGEP